MSKTLYPHVCDYCGKEHFISTSQYISYSFINK